MKNMIIALFLCLPAQKGFCSLANQPEDLNTHLYTKTTDSLPAGADTTNARMQDYVTVQGGKVMIVKNKNNAKPIEDDVTMHDGSVVRKDGTLITRDGKTFILHEGDKVYMSGLVEAPKLQ